MGRSVTRSGPFRAIRTGRWPGVEAPPAGQSGAHGVKWNASKERGLLIWRYFLKIFEHRRSLLYTARAPFTALIIVEIHLNETVFTFQGDDPVFKDTLQGKQTLETNLVNLVDASKVLTPFQKSSNAYFWNMTMRLNESRLLITQSF